MSNSDDNTVENVMRAAREQSALVAEIPRCLSKSSLAEDDLSLLEKAVLTYRQYPEHWGNRQLAELALRLLGELRKAKGGPRPSTSGLFAF